MRLLRSRTSTRSGRSPCRQTRGSASGRRGRRSACRAGRRNRRHEQSWPQAAKNNPTFKAQAQAHLDALPGAVLGYVSTRDGSGAPARAGRDPAGPAKADSVKAWYDEFGQNIDGIYFDELIVPDYQCYVLANAAPVTWQDVPTSAYIDQL